MIDDRYDRQRRLPGVGRGGQEAIEAFDARLPAGPGSGVALAYLVRAGVGRVTISRGEPPAFAHGDLFQFQGPHRAARGAHLALLELRRALSTRGGES